MSQFLDMEPMDTRQALEESFARTHDAATAGPISSGESRTSVAQDFPRKQYSMEEFKAQGSTKHEIMQVFRAYIKLRRAEVWKCVGLLFRWLVGTVVDWQGASNKKNGTSGTKFNFGLELSSKFEKYASGGKGVGQSLGLKEWAFHTFWTFDAEKRASAE